MMIMMDGPLNIYSKTFYKEENLTSLDAFGAQLHSRSGTYSKTSHPVIDSEGYMTNNRYVHILSFWQQLVGTDRWDRMVSHD